MASPEEESVVVAATGQSVSLEPHVQFAPQAQSSPHVQFGLSHAGCTISIVLFHMAAMLRRAYARIDM